MSNIINVLDFHDEQKHGCDMTLPVLMALEKCRTAVNPILTFPEGTYHFWPDNAYEKSYYISNNDYGTKKIAFPVIGYENISIDGGGSLFIFHGRISPFVIDGSRNITISNFSIDYDRPFFTQGLILNAGHSHVDLKMEKTEFPYRVEDNRIIFHGENWESEEDNIMLLTEFDPKTKAPAYEMVFYLTKWPQCKMRFNDTWESFLKVITAQELSDGIVRLTGNFDRVLRPGNILTIGHENRYNPGILINNSENTNLDSINIYHAGAMGLIAQLSKDITVKKLNVALKEGSGRIISTNGDATHFVNCTGTIALDECVFENMLDDAANIHGICTVVSEVLSDNTVEVEMMHYEQKGINVFAPGDRINFIYRENLMHFSLPK